MLLVVFSALMGLCVANPQDNFDPNNIDCSQRPSGVQWWGCNSYGSCQGAQFSQIDCLNGSVYNRQRQQCSDPFSASFPCNLDPQDCSEYKTSPGHRKPVLQQDSFENRPPCSYFYTCAYGFFLGYQPCPYGTVFDEENQRCTYPDEVEGQCGGDQGGIFFGGRNQNTGSYGQDSARSGQQGSGYASEPGYNQNYFLRLRL